MTVHLFGIRHHGPGCARSLAQALEQLQPDAILIEGPPEADDLLCLAADADMKPPVALLVYVPAMPQHAVYFPFAQFSPEWQAISYGQAHGVPTRFIDLPMAHTLAAGMTVHEPDEEMARQVSSSGDALAGLAQAAGFADTETWWDHLVEQRHDSLELFAAIEEMMTVARHALNDPLPAREAQREAHMRQMIRQAVKQGHQNIAVICGAWHVPALRQMPTAKHDKDLLSDLPKAKVAATWTPWTYGRLSLDSGYGAGVQAPGWYHHLWHTPHKASIYWLTDAVRLLRNHGLDASSAHVIEALRLADTLASLRERSRAGLGELLEALQSVLFGDSDAPLRLIERELLVNDRLGAVPAATPTLPLTQDVRQLQKRLRMAPRADQVDLDLDLRQTSQLEKSTFLHRLQLLGIDWGKTRTVSGKSGSFHERWVLAWEPDFELKLIEANVWGATLELACDGFLRHKASQVQQLPELTALVEGMLLADVRLAVPVLMERMQAIAAGTHDAGMLLAAVAPLANVLRYGNVRGTDTGSVGTVVDGLVQRACIALPVAARGINEEAAQALLGKMIQADSALSLLQHPEHKAAWHAALAECVRLQAHALIAGRAVRLLFEQEYWSVEQCAQALSLACTNPVNPSATAEWLEGFLRGSGLLLIVNDALWQILHGWVAGLSDDAFVELLPLLRRTFSTFEAAERRQLGERVVHGSAALPQAAVASEVDEQRAALVLPILHLLTGPRAPTEEAA
ncbi:hypothetical protein KY495_15865 [Massilia sp. PAMC28688]|uniref:DUF5682 family protein n=1 Tax=Massilia sp. PAMC28688 TaxID=2861283 RepID=UPI001C637B69|nr:DUF5682 family protein [Massilia sp. PAMC28688]QYF92229.1 hypothetical protein KY495_15865 [Massilia sp. PAMC28688]